MPAPVTLITGVSRGIGRFLADHYGNKGHQIVGCSRTVPEDWPENRLHRVVDVGDEPAVKGLFSGIRKRFGRLDHLINNAGMAAMNHILLTPQTTVRHIMDTNFTGTFLMCREAAKLMQKHRFGRIVNFTTVAVPLNLEGEAVYAASKAAVEALTRIGARELGQFGITVNAVGPTPIPTDLIAGVPTAKLEMLLQQLTPSRYGTLEDVAHVTDFFLSPQSSNITGQVLYLGGV